MHMYILNENREPVPCPDLIQWARWHGDINNRRVQQDYIYIGNHRVFVSTVFYGIDYGINPDNDKPVLFETLIQGGSLNGATWRYSSWDEAMKGHLHALKYCKKLDTTIN